MHIRPIRSDAEWQLVKTIRTRVFIEEQACPPEEEWDTYDATSRHFLGQTNHLVNRLPTVQSHHEILDDLMQLFRSLGGTGFGQDLDHHRNHDVLPVSS